MKCMLAPSQIKIMILENSPLLLLLLLLQRVSADYIFLIQHNIYR